jgi:enoyl-CoA hydratase/carnithine racemase
MNGFETIIYNKIGTIAYIALNRPDYLNAYNIRMRDELYQILSAIKDDSEVKVVVLKGNGEKAFCAGADLSEFLTAPSPMIARRVRWQRDVWGLFLSLSQPVIAALHGYVLGSGIEMALCCDLRIASDDAKFGLPEVKLGIIPAAGATQTLPRTIGSSRALELLLSGRWIGAPEAFEAKLVNRVVPRDSLNAEIESISTRLASFDPFAVKNAKQALVRGRDLPLNLGLKMERRLAKIVLNSLSA